MPIAEVIGERLDLPAFLADEPSRPEKTGAVCWETSADSRTKPAPARGSPDSLPSRCGRVSSTSRPRRARGGFPQNFDFQQLAQGRQDAGQLSTGERHFIRATDVKFRQRLHRSGPQVHDLEATRLGSQFLQDRLTLPDPDENLHHRRLGLADAERGRPDQTTMQPIQARFARKSVYSR